MQKVLLINSSPNLEQSSSRKAGKMLIERLKTLDTLEITERDLATNPPPHVDWQTVGAYFTPPGNHTPEQKKSIELSNLLTQELVHSDIVVVTAPMWNFSVPSSFKAWVDHVSRVGVTFSITAEGYKGHLKTKKVFVVLSAGGIYSQGPMMSYDFLAPYFKTVFGFFGVTNVEVITVEGTNMPEHKDKAMINAQAQIEKVTLI